VAVPNFLTGLGQYHNNNQQDFTMPSYPRATALSLCLCLSLCLASCKSGYNQAYEQSGPDEDGIPCNPNPVDSGANAAAKSVLKLVATFSCEKASEKKRVMAGQHLGDANQLAATTSSYQTLIGPFADKRTTPAVIAVDYAQQATYSLDTLKNANLQLDKHWKNNGVVMVSWTPANPWRNEFTTGYTSDVLLNDLTSANTAGAANTKFKEDLNNVINALKDLQDKNVAVLWRPFPMMNSKNYWWGLDATGSNEELFEKFWQRVFTDINNAGLNNLIWVYSPLDTAIDTTRAYDWGFDKNFVDVVAPIARNNELTIRDYNSYVLMAKPLAMAELSPGYKSDSSTGLSDGSFDTNTYKNRLTSNYNAVAFWVSANDSRINNTQNTLSLIGNKNAFELLNSGEVYTAEELKSESLRN
jgi:mannan endo-1,4-beta-mannosidase